jgi:hypothetical protein
MDLNTLGILVLGGLISYISYNIYLPDKKQVMISLNNQIGKTRSLQNKSGDSSMFTELLRRQTIQRVGRINFNKLKENFTQTGSKTGAIETFLITGIGQLPKSINITKCYTNPILNGGLPNSNPVYFINGGNPGDIANCIISGGNL